MSNEFLGLLDQVLTEEDVKRIATDLLGIKTGEFKQGRVDLQLDHIWFEAKRGEVPLAHITAQILWYAKTALSAGEALPAWLGVFDQHHIGFLEISRCLDFLKEISLEDIGRSASGVVKNKPVFVKKVKEEVLHLLRVFLWRAESEAAKQFLKGVRLSQPPHVPITVKNYKTVFTEWLAQIGLEIADNPTDFLVYVFLADATHTSLDLGIEVIPPHTTRNKVYFIAGDTTFKSGNGRSYMSFWDKYSRIEDESIYRSVLANKDEMMEIVHRCRTGAFFTPLKVVSVAYNYLGSLLGQDWADEYDVVWDMCAGTANLALPFPHTNKLFLSTIEQSDVALIKANKALAGATIFQYDYLNDDIAPDGLIDYTLTNKVPQELQRHISSGSKILVLINPPYGEAAAKVGEVKTGVAKTALATHLMKKDWGSATNEVFTQFMARVYVEIPSARLAMFSTLKHINGSNFSKFRERFLAEYRGGFVIESNVFEGVNGKFPIGFMVWDLSVKTPITSIKADVLNKSCELINEKTIYALDSRTFLSKWVARPNAKPDLRAVPLGNAVSVAKGKNHLTRWSEDAVGYMSCAGNDYQHASNLTSVLSSTFGNAHGFYITPENLWQAAVVFTARKAIPHTWLNHNDQFLQPTSDLSDEFKTDCLIWMLFNGKNLSASADLDYDSKTYEVKNHFVPFTEIEMGLDASNKIESRFMTDYLKGLVLSQEASNLMDEGLKLFKWYHELKATGEIPRSLRDTYKIKTGCSEGWYQIRNILEQIKGKGFDADLKRVRTALTDKIVPQIFELGFLKP